jgi:hypothetical protein
MYYESPSIVWVRRSLQETKLLASLVILRVTIFSRLLGLNILVSYDLMRRASLTTSGLLDRSGLVDPVVSSTMIDESMDKYILIPLLVTIWRQTGISELMIVIQRSGITSSWHITKMDLATALHHYLRLMSIRVCDLSVS